MIGFLGIGNMGYPMVKNLLKKDFELYLFDRELNPNMQNAQKEGAKIATSLQELGESCDIFISMLPSGEVLRELLFGPEHLQQCMKPGSIIIDMSSANPIHTQATSLELKNTSIHLIDAPVVGGVPFAYDGTLEILVGGEGEVIDRCMPIFQALGKSVTRTGPIGSGHALKSLTNYINTTAMMNMVEAIQIGKSYGIDANVMAQSLIDTCTTRNHPLVKKVIPKILTRKFDSGMSIGLVAKDLSIALSMAQNAQCEHPILKSSTQVVQTMIEELGKQVDQTEVAKFWD